MSFDASDTLYQRAGLPGGVEPPFALYDSTDPSLTRTDIAAVAAAGGAAPYFSTAAGDFSVFAEWDFVLVSGFSTAEANGLFRVTAASTGVLTVSGGLASAIAADAAGDTVTIRKVRLARVSRPGDKNRGGQPQTLQATTSTNLSGTVLQLSLDDGTTWDSMPDVALPDTLAANAKVINFFVGNEALLRLSGVPSNFSGKIWLG